MRMRIIKYVHNPTTSIRRMCAVTTMAGVVVLSGCGSYAHTTKLKIDTAASAVASANSIDTQKYANADLDAANSAINKAKHYLEMDKFDNAQTYAEIAKVDAERARRHAKFAKAAAKYAAETQDVDQELVTLDSEIRRIESQIRDLRNK